ncbi:ATP-binding cassette domain-containing protein [Cuniculiplasma divulgatum]|jgi:ABC-type multidrug transport system ATPase subunit|uniref:ATP-binding cassette domain-containing protein n=1 Tax=Cuniculiplasma divulgatum TaxID=1673428 RepID=UPI0009FB2BD0|nr:ABC transporter ATP-binding protein [Cuniculiplasma divulgatum]MCI2412453.1 ABC transporter ATP-binding protein [Cuniculiplasma sp.]OWP54827.1 MAG: hypothetical protein B2I18_06310 [Cuniculiplasma sp. C_DKE]WMT48647.1 MAG: ABC transporter ATP-binding protein [Thermoplasmatales archaeon]
MGVDFLTNENINKISLECDNVTKSYGVFKKTIAIRNLGIKELGGTCVSLVGPNGAGKSTILKVLSGSIRKYDGKVTVRGSVGYCPEISVNFDFMSAEENLSYFYPHNIERIKYILTRLNLNTGKKPISSFSKGMKRKLDLARSLILGSEIILMDEPFDGLDAESSKELSKIIEDLKIEGKLILITSHDLHKVENVSDKILFMKDGTIFQKLILKHLNLYRIDFTENSDVIRKKLTDLNIKIVGETELSFIIQVDEGLEICKLITKILGDDCKIVGFSRESLESIYMRELCG